MNGSMLPLVALVGGGTLLYLGLRRGREEKNVDTGKAPSVTYCDIRSEQPCGETGECVPLYDAGAAPPGYENMGMCMTEVQQ